MGRWHAHALMRAGGQVVAVADMNAQSARLLAQAYRAHAFASVDELLKQSPVDVVHICTPLATHVELTMQALEAGAHIIIEKPLTSDAETTAQLSQLAPLVHLELMALTAGGEDMDAVGRDQLVADILPHALALFQRCLSS